jgi:hypothetical protein
MHSWRMNVLHSVQNAVTVRYGPRLKKQLGSTNVAQSANRTVVCEINSWVRVGVKKRAAILAVA